MGKTTQETSGSEGVVEDYVEIKPELLELNRNMIQSIDVMLVSSLGFLFAGL